MTEPKSPPDPAIVSLQSGREDLLVFEVLDRIRRADIEIMASRVDAAFHRFDQIDILVLMTNFEGVDAGAVFDRKALGVEARSLKQVRRYAVVGAPTWVAAMIEVSDVVSPVDAKTFSLEDLLDARAWVDATDETR